MAARETGRDRREVLRLLAGGTATAAATTAIATGTAFADGGTQSFRPVCTVGTTTYNCVIGNFMIFSVTPGAGAGCSAGWTESIEYAWTVAPTGLGQYRPSGTPVNNGAFVSESSLTVAGSFGPIAPIPQGTSVTVVVVSRRTCTNVANPTRKAWCCVRYSRTATFDTVVNQWGGASQGLLPGIAGTSAALGCTAP